MTEQNATKVPLPNDEDDFFSHPICNNYESNVNGVVRNIKSKKEVGHKINNGYYQISCKCCKCCSPNGNPKIYYKHRFIWESLQGLIDKGNVIDHIDNNPSNNKIENLQIITQSENLKKNHVVGARQAQKIRAINIETGDVFMYRSITGASKDLHINAGSIFSVLNGTTKTALSKKLNQRFTFQKIDHENEQNPLVIINKYKTNNIKAKKIVNFKC